MRRAESSHSFLDIDRLVERRDGEGWWHALARHEAEVMRHYWQVILQNERARRPPMVTIAFMTTCICVFHLVDRHGQAYTADGPWYSAFVAAASHTSERHLMSNMIMLGLLGVFFEFTEGFRHTLSVLYAGALLGAAFHGALRARPVRGASGAIYALLWSQLSLLLLNWREMPLRWVRLLLCLMMLGLDIGMYVNERQRNTSYSSHLFGAVAGMCVALVLGKNVQLRRRDLAGKWAGMVGYSALVLVAGVYSQRWPARFAAALVPVLGVRVLFYTRRAFIQQRTRSQRPTLPREATTRMKVMSHGTHKVLTALLFLRRVRPAAPAAQRARAPGRLRRLGTPQQPARARARAQSAPCQAARV